MTLAAGMQLGPYTLLSPIGAGGMGQVWKARDTRLHRVVAVKKLDPALNGAKSPKPQSSWLARIQHTASMAGYRLREAGDVKTALRISPAKYRVWRHTFLFRVVVGPQKMQRNIRLVSDYPAIMWRSWYMKQTARR
jgi:serine/threonine protein kinase